MKSKIKILLKTDKNIPYGKEIRPVSLMNMMNTDEKPQQNTANQTQQHIKITP